jgi:hypothetical protein
MPMNRNFWAAIAATIAVVAVVVLGFRVLGGPGTQRMMQSDLRTVRALSELAQQINMKWGSSGKELPKDLEKLPNSIKQDLVSGKALGYRAKSSNEYELCATFKTDNRDAPGANTADPWIHPKGDYCFPFDASQPVPSVPYYY